MTTATTGLRSAAGPYPHRCAACGAPVRTIRSDRRFSMMDAMILIAASAVAFAIVRPTLNGTMPLLREPGWARYLAMAIGALVTWTPAALILQLRSPRPTVRRMSRRPGFAASVAGTAIIALGAITIGLLAWVREVRKGLPVPRGVPPRGQDPSWWLGVVIHFGAIVGPAVMAAWVLLAISGRRRASWNWLDLLGRALGAGWIVLFVINACARLWYLRD